MSGKNRPFMALVGSNHESSRVSAQSSEGSPDGLFCVKNCQILDAVNAIQGSLRQDLYAVLQKIRVDVFERNAVLLRAAEINDHSTEHQDRDAYMVWRVFEAFPDKLNPHYLEPAVAASMVHDQQYILAAKLFARNEIEDLKKQENARLQPEIDRLGAFLTELDFLSTKPLHDIKTLWTDGTFPPKVGKKALDSHAMLGGVIMQSWMNDPLYADAFGIWNDTQKRVAELTIHHHSNGSEGEACSVPLEALVLRLVDKLDNTFSRVTSETLSVRTLNDSTNCHRYVPLAIRAMQLLIDRSCNTFTVEYEVDYTKVNEAMRPFDPHFEYSHQRFLEDFHKAYGMKSMPIAAQVVDRLFASEEDDLYADDAVFQVRCIFPDKSTHVQVYKRLGR